MRILLFIPILLFILLESVQAKDINVLLDELVRKDDLSQYTKKETAGFIKIFTREDLDRMKIKSFDELLEKIPYVRNKTDHFGLSDPYYKPYQMSNPSRVRLFINDNEVLVPLYGSGLGLFGQIDMSYIDHIEIYIGIPSYEVAIEPSIAVIKAYTKVGKRENSSVVGSSLGNHDTYDTYVYKSEKLDKYSYLTYINHRDLKRDKVKNLGSKLSRDKRTTHAYAQLSDETSNFELQAVNASFDAFAGNSMNMNPTNAYSKVHYFSSAYTYQMLEKSLKATLHYTYLNTHYDETSTSPVGFVGISPFYEYERNTKEHLLDAKITKIYNYKNRSVLFGFGNRLKKFKIDLVNVDGVEQNMGSSYDTENITSLFTEVKYFPDTYNQIILSLNTQYYFENAGVDNDNIYGARLGHIYKKDNFKQKTFFVYGKFHPSTSLLLSNDQVSSGTNKLKSEKVYFFSTKALLEYDQLDYSLSFSRGIYEDGLVADSLRNQYLNLEDKYIINSMSFLGSFAFNSTDKIDFMAWTLIMDYGSNTSDRYRNSYGGFLSLYKKFLVFDTYNSIAYVDGGQDNPDGWNYNATITYEYSKKLSFFLKGKNLLKKALTSDYIKVNPANGNITRLDNIANIDRTVWFGLEYKF